MSDKDIKKAVDYALIYKLACMAYKSFLRDLLIRAIDDPETTWDDTVLSIADAIFSYSDN